MYSPLRCARTGAAILLAGCLPVNGPKAILYPPNYASPLFPLLMIVEQAWSAFRRAGDLPSRVVPAVPILFFGDLQAYSASETRVLTVGLNPSLQEFPKESPFLRTCLRSLK